MSRLRLLADDLTGALDSAAQFVPFAGRIPTFWHAPRQLPWPAAIDAGTRDLDAVTARSMLHRLAPLLDDAEPAFKKFDSLLRGHVAAEIGGCARGFDHCVVVPAFPAQRRITRDGRQLWRDGGNWRDAGLDLAAELRREGIPVVLRRPGEAPPEGASLWDAETDDDLDAVVAAIRGLPGRVLWCGTGGLAGALAGRLAIPIPDLPRPVLALIGSNHQTSIAQLSAAWAHVHRIVRGSPDEAAPIARRLTHANAAVAVVVPPNVIRATAARHVARCFAGLLAALDPPGTLVASGGETLRAVCDVLGAARLDVDGAMMPGVPTSVMRGGRWDGLRVVSKSGAFGDAGFLAHLLAPSRSAEEPRRGETS